MKTSLTNHRSKQFPVVDCNFQSVTLGGCNGRSIRRPSIRNVSREYFDKEAQRSFATEAALFAAMIVTVTVPIVSGAVAIMQLCRTLAF